MVFRPTGGRKSGLTIDGVGRSVEPPEPDRRLVQLVPAAPNASEDVGRGRDYRVLGLGRTRVVGLP